MHFFGRVFLSCGSFGQAKNAIRSAYFTICVRELFMVSDFVFFQ